MRLPTTVWLVSIALVSAGCASGPVEDEVAAPAQAAPPTPTDVTGSIEGLVTDDEGLPLAGVDVVVLDTEETTRSADDGVFVFNDLDEGKYRLAASKLGYTSVATVVSVLAGAVVSASFELAPIEITIEAFADVYIFEGYLQCGVNPYWPSNVCGDHLGENEARFFFETTPSYEFEGTVFELVWTPATAATGQHLELDVCDQTDPGAASLACFDGNTYWDYASGTSPLVLRLDGLPVDQFQVYEADVGAGFPSTSDPASVLPAIQQSFTLYVSVCYYGECADDYQARPPDA